MKGFTEHNDYRMKDKFLQSRHEHIEALMKEPTLERYRRAVERDGLKFAFKTEGSDMIDKLMVIIYSGEEGVVGELRTLFNNLFDSYAKRFHNISIHKASNELDVSKKMVKHFMYVGALSCSYNYGTKRNRISMADVETIKSLQEESPEDFEEFKRYLVKLYDGCRRKRAVRVKDENRVIDGKAKITKRGNVFHLALKEGRL